MEAGWRFEGFEALVQKPRPGYGRAFEEAIPRRTAKALRLSYWPSAQHEKPYTLVHASPKEFYRKDMWRYLDQTQFTVWERIEDYTQIPDEYTLIFGHTPTVYYAAEDRLRIWYDERKIGIDCGSGLDEIARASFPHQGNLACLRLDDMQEFYSDEADKPIDPNKIPRDKV